MATKAAKACKQIGRRVRNLDTKAWNAISPSLMRSINACKFAQNKRILAKMMETGDRVIAEASPNDALWGIGLKEADARKVAPDKWPGKNLLGKALTSIRNDFRSRGPFSETARIP